MAKVDDKKYAEFMAKRKKEKKQTSTQKSLADIRARAEKVKEGYVSMAQQRAVWATRKDGGKGHPDNKKKNKKEDVNEISKNMASRYIKKSQVSTADAAKSVERGNIDSKSPDKDIAKAGKDQAKKGIKNFINRNKGTATAVDKLTGKAKVKATEAYGEPQGQAKRMMSPLQKMRQGKEKADRDRDGRLKAGIAAMKKAGNAKAKAELGEKILTQKDKERAFAKAAKTAKPKSQVSLKKAPFKTIYIKPVVEQWLIEKKMLKLLQPAERLLKKTIQILKKR